MGARNILIVDPDPVVCRRLEDVLSKQGWGVETCPDARGALRFLEKQRPDLVILELQLPDVHGLEFIATLRQRPQWRTLPLIVVTEEREPESRLEALRLGVLEYLTKPYDRNELLFRIRNLLTFSELGETTPTAGTSSRPEDRLLALMASGEIDELVPNVDCHSRYGYTIPAAAEILGLTEKGAELDILDDLASGGKLSRTFLDVVHLCPSCGHHDLNFREVCPACESANIKIQNILRHVVCGHRAPQSEFFGGAGQCPKCGGMAEREGLVPAGARFICRQCHSTFEQPIVVCRCLSCGQLRDVEELERRVIWSYRAAPSLVRPQAEPWRPSVRPSLLQPLLSDSFPQILPPERVVDVLEEELKRAAAESSNLTVAQINLEGISKIEQRIGSGKLSKLLTAAVKKMSRVFRSEDRIAYYGPSGLLIIMPHTDVGDARILGERVLIYLRQVLPRTYVSVRLAGYPQDGKVAREILEMLEVGIETVGNAVA